MENLHELKSIDFDDAKLMYKSYKDTRFINGNVTLSKAVFFKISLLEKLVLHIKNNPKMMDNQETEGVFVCFTNYGENGQPDIYNPTDPNDPINNPNLGKNKYYDTIVLQRGIKNNSNDTYRVLRDNVYNFGDLCPDNCPENLEDFVAHP
ncbi:hypothetical protein N9231_02580 [Saprospiraceae bacterium]|nr:hypothetical protein [Saprospiraceae bacterium]